MMLSYLDGFLGLLPKTRGNTWLRLYALYGMESFLYDSPDIGSFILLYSFPASCGAQHGLAQLLGYY